MPGRKGWGNTLKNIHHKLKPWYIVVAIFFLWWLAAKLEVWNSYLLPSPAKVFSTFLAMVKKGEIATAIMVSLRRVLTGFTISFTLAFLCAVISAYAPGVAEYFRFIGNFFRNAPPIAMISLLILWFGLGETPKLIIILLASFFPMTMNIATGFLQCDEKLLEVGKSLHFSKLQQFFRITLPASRLNILTGIRIGLGYSWRALIGAEMFAAAAGLGYMIVFAQQMSRSDKVLIGILMIGMIGALTDAALRFLISMAEKSIQPGTVQIAEPDAGNSDTKKVLREAEKSDRDADDGAGQETGTHKGESLYRSWYEIPSGSDSDVWEAVGESGDGQICLQHVSKQFTTDKGVLQILEDVSIRIPADRITVVLGKSGCGKTTLLRMISGLDTDYEGTIRIPDGMKSAFVFQESRLMPWLRVRDNITFGMKKNGISEKKVQGLLDLTGLSEFEHARPAQLSGGMQQRTAIARALAVEPDFLLMDEPFAALDYFTREGMQKSLLSIQKQTGCGILFITHSVDEALAIADQILILGGGKIYKRYQLTAGTVQSHPDGGTASGCTGAGEKPAMDLSELKADILMNI